MDRSADRRAEAIFECRPGNADGVGDAGDVGLLPGGGPQGLKRLQDSLVRRGHRVGRCAGNHADRRDHKRLQGRLWRGPLRHGPCLHEPVERRGRLIADPPCRLVDARKRRSSEIADHLVVVDAEHGDIMRHAQTQRPAGLEHVPGADVITGHQPHRLREFVDPGLQFPLEVFPAAGGGMAAREHMTRPAHRSARRRKRRGPLLRPATRRRPWITVKGERFEAAPQQMLGAEPADRIDVRNAGGGFVPAVAAADGHDRDRQAADGGGNAAVIEVGDDSLTVPMPQIGQLLQRILLDVQAPCGMLVHILRDAADDQTVVGAGSIEDDGHQPRCRAVFRLLARHGQSLSARAGAPKPSAPAPRSRGWRCTARQSSPGRCGPSRRA